MQLLLITELYLCNVLAYIKQNNVRRASEYCMVSFCWRYTSVCHCEQLFISPCWPLFFKWLFIFLNIFRYFYNLHFNKYFTLYTSSIKIRWNISLMNLTSLGCLHNFLASGFLSHNYIACPKKGSKTIIWSMIPNVFKRKLPTNVFPDLMLVMICYKLWKFFESKK